MYSVIFYTNNLVCEKILNLCLSTLIGTTKQHNAELVVVSWQPLPVQKNVVWNNHEANHENIYKQIMAGLKHCTYERIFLAEHDVLYPKSHFDLEPLDKIIYDSNVYHLNQEGYFKAEPVNFLSTLVARKEILDRALREKLRELQKTGRVVWAEPHGPNGFERIEGENPIVDIRHNRNLTGMRSAEIYLEVLPPWGSYVKFGLW